MQQGTVKWFNSTKGYGFIKPSTGDKDVFVHISAVERAGLRTLNEGQSVEYELVTNRGRTSAETGAAFEFERQAQLGDAPGRARPNPLFVTAARPRQGGGFEVHARLPFSSAQP